MSPAWHVYLIECTDGSLYTGVAVDVAKRYAMHATGKGARYTRSHPPLRLAALLACTDRGAALRAEHAIKQRTVAGKREFCVLHPAPAAVLSQIRELQCTKLNVSD